MRRRLVLVSLALAAVALISPLGLYMLRVSGGLSLFWVFGIWAGLVALAAIASAGRDE